MRILPLACLLATSACQQGSAPPDSDFGFGAKDEASPAETPLRPATSKPAAATGEWQAEKGSILFVDGRSGRTLIAIACQGGTLEVSLPGVAPIGSEERLSVGGGGELETLVAAPDRSGSVHATGPAPDGSRLRALLEAGPGASYGATAIGPLVPVPGAMASAFAERCLS